MEARRREVFVHPVYEPGELAEVDLVKVLVDVAGARRSGRACCLRFLDGHYSSSVSSDAG